jgi:hypothetical protein
MTRRAILAPHSDDQTLRKAAKDADRRMGSSLLRSFITDGELTVIDAAGQTTKVR